MLMVPQILSSVAPSGSSTCAAGHDSPLLSHEACCTQTQSQASGALQTSMTSSSPDRCPPYELDPVLDCQGRLKSSCKPSTGSQGAEAVRLPGASSLWRWEAALLC